MTMTAENPRAVAGSNEAPDYARQVTEAMARDYAEVGKTVTELLAEARDLPTSINDDETMGIVARVVKRMKDVKARLEAFREKEKEPYLRGGNAVDQFFNGLRMKLMREKKTENAGAVDVLMARIDDYQQRKLAAETKRRMEAEAEARKEADRLAEIRRQEEQKQREAEAAAARARKPSTIEQHEDAAAVAAAKVSEARVNEDAARTNLSDAIAASSAKPADLVRARLDDGVMATMAKEPYVEIVDAAKLDHTTLWAFVKDDHKLQALRAWAKVTQHRTPMAGAIIEMRNKSVIR